VATTRGDHTKQDGAQNPVDEFSTFKHQRKLVFNEDFEESFEKYYTRYSKKLV
jgi:hypothetical protein